MKALFYTMALSLALLPLAGCETLSQTPGENFSDMVHATSTDFRQIPEDVERDVLLIDRPSWLARQPVPNE